MTTMPLPAPAWRRFAAIVYDVLAVVAIVMVVGLLAQIATKGGVADATGHIVAWWYQPLQGLVVGAYFLLSWMRGGQTLGMRPWRIRVVARDGGALGMRRGLLRLMTAGLPLLLLLLYGATSLKVALTAPLVGWAVMLIPCLADARRRGLHDIVADTEIRLLDPELEPPA